VKVQRLLFICGQNRLRSPTAEQLFASWPGVETDSAGLKAEAETPVTPEALAWADLILVMEGSHRRKLAARFPAALKGKRVVSLDIPDEYDYMDPALVALLQARVPPLLR